MKVVLFCGGLGMRLSPTTERIPKPLVTIGEKPILLQLMKYYAHFGHKDFILCLGYKGDSIKKYFLNYDEYLSSDFVFSNGGKDRTLIKHELDDWKITFVDTGLNSNIGQRLMAVAEYLDGEDQFLANYSDAVTNLHLPTLIDFFIRRNKTACMITVKPFYSYHAVTSNGEGLVTDITPLIKHEIRINGGFFIFKNKIFDYLQGDEDLVDKTFQRLIPEEELLAYEFNGFWASMDTYKDKQQLDELAANGKAPWRVWQK